MRARSRFYLGREHPLAPGLILETHGGVAVERPDRDGVELSHARAACR